MHGKAEDAVLELNWSTFFLEIVNFLVLVWLLKRFFYRPLLQAIARRRAGIDQTLKDAETVHDEAEALQRQYQERLAVWERERQAALDDLAKEIEEERARRLTALRATLEQEREKASVLAKRQTEIERQRSEELALEQGAEFAARLLAQAASPELESRLIDLLIGELARAPRERFRPLLSAAGKPPEGVVVTSAFPMPESARNKLQAALASALGSDVSLTYEQDSGLCAGLRINIGSWVLGANLQDELKAFAEVAREA